MIYVDQKGKEGLAIKKLFLANLLISFLICEYEVFIKIN